MDLYDELDDHSDEAVSAQPPPFYTLLLMSQNVTCRGVSTVVMCPHVIFQTGITIWSSLPLQDREQT
jgi:hypothetical protein